MSCNSSHWWFAHSFLLQCILPYLTESEVFTCLMLVCKHFKCAIINRPINTPVTLDQWRVINSCDRYTYPITITHIHQFKNSDTFDDHSIDNVNKLKTLTLSHCFNEPIKPDSLPQSLTSLKFTNPVFSPHTWYVRPCKWIYQIQAGMLPNTLTSLEFPNSFNQQITIGVLPDTLRILYFGSSFNQRFDCHVLPDSLTSLSFGWHFNQPIDVDVLPQSLQCLQFGRSFVHHIKHDALPRSLTSLTFTKWTWTDDNDDASVISDQVTLPLPVALKTLELGETFVTPIRQGMLPQSLTSLTLAVDFTSPITPGVFPSSLQSLRLFGRINQVFQKGVFPSSLTSLKLSRWCTSPLKKGVLPPHLTSLELGMLFNQRIHDHVLPNSLTSLNLGYSFNQPIKRGLLPQTLTELSFGHRFSHPLGVGVLPQSLRSCSFGGMFNHPLAGVLPELLTDLEFRFTTFFDSCPRTGFQQQITSDMLPSSLKSLLAAAYKQVLDINLLPRCLTLLKLGNISGNPWMNSSFVDQHNVKISKTQN